MLSLIGEQPLPNLLMLKHIDPDEVILAYTAFTEKVCEKIRKLYPNKTSAIKINDPYDIVKILPEIREIFAQRNEIIFNLTGGTKPMALAAYSLALEMKMPFVYLQSEGGKSIAYQYAFKPYNLMTDLTVEKVEVSKNITIDEYLRIYLGEYNKEDLKNDFENTLSKILEEAKRNSIFDEVENSIKHGGALEIDFIVRHKNQFTIIEAKTGKTGRSKEGINQLNTAAEQRYLGTYIKKILVIEGEMGSNLKELAKEHKIEVIEIFSWDNERKEISGEEKQNLVAKISQLLGE